VDLGVYGTGNLVVSNANVQLGATAIANYAGGSFTVESNSFVSLGENYLRYLGPDANGKMSLFGGGTHMPGLQRGVQGTGTVNVAGGLLTTALLGLGETNGAFGALNISGGSTIVTGALYSGTNFSTGQINLSGGALYVTNGSSSGFLNVGNGSLVQ